MPTATLATVVPTASSYLNAAGWKNYLHGMINATSGALTVTDAAFTADDIGKKIAIDGAGAGGSVYEGTITGFTSATQVTVSPTVATSVVGATVSYGGRLHDDRRNLFELREAAFEADEAHYLAVAETKGHWLRPELLVLSAEIVHGDNLGAEIPHIGPLGEVFIQPSALAAFERGQRANAEEIARMRLNTGTAPLDTYGSKAHNAAGTQIGTYYWMPEDENTIHNTGDSVKIYYVPTYTRGADLKSNQIFTGSIASHMVARLLAKEGAKTPTHATIHGSYAEAVIAGIRNREPRVPSLQEFQQDASAGRRAQ